jgi:pilus assembly protein CpaF
MDIFAATIDHYLAPIQPYLKDPDVTEVMINGFDRIYIEKAGKLEKTPVAFTDDEAYLAAVRNILQFTGRSMREDQPLVDARLPDGSRVHVAGAPCARHGTVVTIRKFSKTNLDIDWLVELGTLTDMARQFLRIAVRAERNILVAGGTSSGKTSLLNALSSYIPSGERIVVIEDSAELQLQQSHVVSLEARPADRYGRGAVTIRDLFRSSLRLRPDRIVIGEVRGGEALDMIQAMTSGHGGSMGTLHANNSQDALNRLETMALMSKVDLPLHALRAQVASAIDIVVQMSRHVGGKRLVTQITEIDPLSDDGQYRLRNLFTLQQAPSAPGGAPGEQKSDKAMQLAWTGERSAMAGKLRPSELKLVTPALRPVFAIEDQG